MILGKFEALPSTNFSKVGCGRLLATAALLVRILTSLKNTKQRHGQHILAHEKKLYRIFVESLSENTSTKFCQFFPVSLTPFMLSILSIQIYFVSLFCFLA
jgi:hypothetical protein